MWIGPATVALPCEPEDGAGADEGADERAEEEGSGKELGVGAESEPVEYACEATACRSADASAGLGAADAACCSAVGEGAAGGVGALPGVGRRNIASMVGRRAAPKGVERKSEGRSARIGCVSRQEWRRTGVDA